jgi:hypothetical protein
VITFIGWESRGKLGDLTLARSSVHAHSLRSIATVAAPSSNVGTRSPTRPPTPARLHQRPRSNCSPAWSAPPRGRLLCSWSLPELLHATSNCSRRLPTRRCPVGARPLHCFLDHQPRHRRPTPSTITWPSSASLSPRPISPGRCRSPPLAAPPPDSLHRLAPDAARLP